MVQNARWMVVACLLAACGGDDTSAPQCAQLLPGDLVITEVFADASGDDAGQEWFEVYNASSNAVSLQGLTLVHSRGDGSMRKIHVLDAVTVESHDYLVLGNTVADLAPAWVDVGYGADLGDLYNTGTGRLALQCQTTEIDAATYSTVKSGRSRELDGGKAPDYTINDDQAQWCPSSSDAANEFSTGNYGTPGGPNEDCEVIVPGMCDDGVSLRPVVPPAPGDLVITEIMTNPSAVSDTLGEWFEVQATHDVDLNGLSIERVGDSSAAETLQAESCLHLAAGAFVVFGHSPDSGVNGGLPAVDFPFSFSLVSGSAASPGDIQLSTASNVIDAVSWQSSPTGKSLQVDPDFANSTDNDDPTHFCAASQAYGDGDLGTPGAPNAECPLVAPPGSCIDGATTRPIVAPAAGDLVITEVMPNPEAVSDTVGEWFEVVATKDVDLNGLGLDRASDSANPNVVSSAACLHVAAGERAVFARSRDAATNGGLADVAGTFTFSLISGSASTPGDVQLVANGTVLDAVTWTRSTPGASLQLDPDFTNVDDNDIETNWCDGATPYGAGDLGTPKADNAQCSGGPATGQCLDNGTSRAIVSPIVGDLVITEIMPSPSAVSDTTGEWFEVLVANDVDLNGVGLDRASDTSNPVVIASTDCVHVTAGTRLVFARSADPALNGGLPDVARTFSFSLITGSASTPGDVQLTLGAMTLDSVLWTHSTSGAALQLSPAYENAVDNDDESHWCDASTTYGAGDLGTPAADNTVCAMAPSPGTCVDNGGSRAIVKPTGNQLVITEIMPNPTTEPGQEWFEIYNAGGAAFDLNELGLDRANDTRAPDVITSPSCKSLAAGAYAVFARSSDAATNGGLPTPDATFGFSMVNTSGDVRVLDSDGMTVLDAVTWSTSSDGKSSQLDPDFFTTAGNDSTTNFCASTTTYGDGTNKGTPAAANAQCP